MPNDVAMASDLGGNCLAVSRDSKNRDTAVDFLEFAVDEDNMRAFITAGQYLAVRRALMNAELQYALRPEATEVVASSVSRSPSAPGSPLRTTEPGS